MVTGTCYKHNLKSLVPSTLVTFYDKNGWSTPVAKVCLARGARSRGNPPYGKRWHLYILPQYLANLTQPIGT